MRQGLLPHLQAAHEMEVVAHDYVCEDVDSKRLGQLLHSIEDPLLAVGIVFPGQRRVL